MDAIYLCTYWPLNWLVLNHADYILSNDTRRIFFPAESVWGKIFVHLKNIYLRFLGVSYLPYDQSLYMGDTYEYW